MFTVAFGIMTTAQQPGGPTDRRMGPNPLGGWFFKGILLFLVGAVFGVGALQTVSRIRERERVKATRQRAEAVYAQISPQVEVELTVSQRLLDGLREDLAQAGVAAAASEIQWKSYASRQRQIETELDKANQGLSRLSALTEQIPVGHAEDIGFTLLRPEHQEKLSDLQSQYDNARQSLRAAGAASEWIKERHQQLVLADANRSLRSTVETSAPISASVIPVLALERSGGDRSATDSSQLAPLQAVQRMAEVAERAQNESLQRAYLDAFQRLTPAAPPAPVVQCAPTVVYRDPPLIIGQSYPDRYLGYRLPWNSRESFYGGFAGYGGYGGNGYYSYPRGSWHRCAYRW